MARAKPMRIGITRIGFRQDLLALMLALVAGASLLGMFVAQHPRIGIVLVPILVIGEIAFLWLVRNLHARALVGGMVFLTILRPWPNIGNPFITGRGVDLLWLVMAFVVVIITTGGARRIRRIWPGSYWLLAMTGSVLISLAAAIFILGQPVIIRDLFELYRGPYYFLIFLAASQITWDDRQLRDYLFKPLIIALWIAFAVSVLQGTNTELRSMVGYVYTPKSASDLTNALATGEKLRSPGTFANPNWYGVALSMIIPFLLAGFSGVGRVRLMAVIWLTSITAFLFLGITGSRTALVAGILALGIYFLWSLWDSRQRTTRLRVSRSGVSRVFTLLFAATAVLLLLAFISQTARIQELTAALTQGTLLDIESASHKWSGSITLARETMGRSPLVGLGPSKQISQVAGDNQYSRLFFRYGILGLVMWFGFWLTIFRHALRLKRQAQTPLQASMARAVLATVPAFLVAGTGGGFFDATQIATLYLLLIGIAFSSKGAAEEQPSVGVRSAHT